MNMASPIFNIISCIGILIAIGGNTLTAISLGEQNKGKANHYFNNAFYTLLMIAVVIFIMVVFFPHVLARIVGENSVLFPMVGNLLSVVLNIILDLIFICVFDMGITGAALASDFGDFTVCLVDGEFLYPSFNVW